MYFICNYRKSRVTRFKQHFLLSKILTQYNYSVFTNSEFTNLQTHFQKNDKYILIRI